MEAGGGGTWGKFCYVYMKTVKGSYGILLCVWSIYVHYIRILYVCTGL